MKGTKLVKILILVLFIAGCISTVSLAEDEIDVSSYNVGDTFNIGNQNYGVIEGVNGPEAFRLQYVNPTQIDSIADQAMARIPETLEPVSGPLFNNDKTTFNPEVAYDPANATSLNPVLQQDKSVALSQALETQTFLDQNRVSLTPQQITGYELGIQKLKDVANYAQGGIDTRNKWTEDFTKIPENNGIVPGTGDDEGSTGNKRPSAPPKQGAPVNLVNLQSDYQGEIQAGQKGILIYSPELKVRKESDGISVQKSGETYPIHYPFQAAQDEIPAIPKGSPKNVILDIEGLKITNNDGKIITETTQTAAQPASEIQLRENLATAQKDLNEFKNQGILKNTGDLFSGAWQTWDYKQQQLEERVKSIKDALGIQKPKVM